MLYLEAFFSLFTNLCICDSNKTFIFPCFVEAFSRSQLTQYLGETQVRECSFFVCVRKIPNNRNTAVSTLASMNVFSHLTLFCVKFQQAQESVTIKYHLTPGCLLPIVISVSPGVRNSTGSTTFTTPFPCGLSWESWSIAGSRSSV